MAIQTVDGTTYAQRVGVRLRMVRKQKALSLQDVEAASGQEFKASVLGAYERGERAISVPRLQRLARFYGVPVDRLLPEDPGSQLINLAAEEDEDDLLDTSPRRSPDETVTIDLTRLQTVIEPEGDLLNRYLMLIQLQRQDFNGRVLTVRRDDLRAIACMFGTTPDGIRRRLDDMGLRALH